MIGADLTQALKTREQNSWLKDTEAARLFHGPADAKDEALKDLAIDRYKDHLWITEWKKTPDTVLNEIIQWANANLDSLKAIVLMDRTEIASEKDVRTIWGEATPTRFSVIENGVPYLVQMSATKHPGLFLDHVALRHWLKETQNGKTVLNLFAYTGSLSVAAGVGGASAVTTLDLSKNTIDWAKENWLNANLSAERGDFIYGDVFEWLPKMKKRGNTFDTIISDPPSFSRSKSGTFSTKKDLARLHELILPLLNEGGILVTSINSENISEKFFLNEIQAAARNLDTGIQVLQSVELPQTFTAGRKRGIGEDPAIHYLKGFYLRKTAPSRFISK